MPIFQVTPLASNAEKVGSAVVAAIPEESRYELPNSAGWFVSFKGTTIELSHALAVTGQPDGAPHTTGSVLITSIVSYYGRGSAEMWEWLKTRFENAA